MPLHPDDEPGFHEGIWDADPDVCCAAYQLGACVHTEAPDYDEMAYQDELESTEYWSQYWAEQEEEKSRDSS